MIIILVRVGITLDLRDLKKVGRPAPLSIVTGLLAGLLIGFILVKIFL